MNIYYSTNTSIRLSGSALKIIAVLSMVADHGAYYLMEHGTLLYEVMRCFGRIAFPVFAFLIAEGFRHTKKPDEVFPTAAGICRSQRGALVPAEWRRQDAQCALYAGTGCNGTGIF